MKRIFIILALLLVASGAWAQEPMGEKREIIIKVPVRNIEAPEPVIETPEPVVEMQEPVIEVPEPVVEVPEPVIETPRSVVEAQEPVFQGKEFIIDTHEPRPKARKERGKGPFNAPGRRYINLAYAYQQLQFGSYAPRPIKSDKGAAIEFGTTFMFNKNRPIANMVRIGLDFSYIDLQYASFNLGGIDNNGRQLKGHFINTGMQIGPSVMVTPIKRLHAKVYVHYAPSFVAFSPSDFSDISGGYAGYITGGLQVSYMFLTLGVEFRSATTKLSTFQYDNFEIDDITDGDIFGPKVNTRLPSTRLIFGFRF